MEANRIHELRVKWRPLFTWQGEKVKGIIRPRSISQMINTCDILLSAGYCTATEVDEIGFKIYWGF